MLWVRMQSNGTELESFSVGKQVAAYLSTVSSQHTMDHLMYEISQLLHESDDPSMSKSLAARTGKVSMHALLAVAQWCLHSNYTQQSYARSAC